jgi:hypothetical protein
MNSFIRTFSNNKEVCQFIDFEELAKDSGNLNNLDDEDDW